MHNYWFGNSHRLAALLVAAIDLTNALIHAATVLIVICCPQQFINASTHTYFLFPANYFPDLNAFSNDPLLPLVAIAAVFAAEASLVVLLLFGILQRDPGKLDIWTKIRLVLLCLGTFGYVFEMSLMPFPSLGQVTWVTLILLLAIAYRGYSILIVRSFRADLLFLLNGDDLGLRLYATHDTHGNPI